MVPQRREFLKKVGWLTAAGGGVAAATPAVASDRGHRPRRDHDAVLVDTSLCIGCRLCEYACRSANGIDPGPLASYDDTSVFARRRRPVNDCLTVVDSRTVTGREKPVYAKLNCMHCEHPACASACIVGALRKQDNGAVTYDAWKCIGCRYCMVACPFGLPTYEYDDVLTPEVRKCQFCFSRTIGVNGGAAKAPACVEACPRQALTYGRRSELVAQAHRTIERNPGQYVNHVYGEHEVGGTSWLYLSPVPFEELGFLSLGPAAPPKLTEAIQHGVFKYWIAPVGWYAFLATMYWYTGRKAAVALASHRPASPIEHVEENSREAGETPTHETPHHHEHPAAAPVDRKLMTPGVWALLALVLTGVGFGLYRFIFGLAASTNLDQEHPWGLWIAMDVGSGIALAGGGFVTAALVHIFHREHYHAVARSALLTALLGYTFYVPGLLADIGRWYNIWHPTLPNMWQGNSVLFEVGLCVMIYLNVQYAELLPIACERFMSDSARPKLARFARTMHDAFEKIMPALLVLGVCLSTFHQSSLGNLMVIAPYKMHALWWTPVSPILFLLSAMMVGFPMVIFTLLFASRCLRRQPEMDVLTPLSRYVPIFLAPYLILKVADVIARSAHVHLMTLTPQSASWVAEMTLGVVLPLVLFLVPAVRRSPRWLAIACLTVILGVVLNRLNVFVIGYSPPFATRTYFPSITEFAVSIGLVAALLLAYRVAVIYLPILEPRPEVKSV